MSTESEAALASAERVVVAVRADLHANSPLGLLNPATVLEQESPPHGIVAEPVPLTGAQATLWAFAEEDRKRVAELAAGAPVVIIDLGDLGHGSLSGFSQRARLLSDRPGDEIIMAADLYQPWLADSDMNVVAVRLQAGTPFHEGPQGSLVTAVAEMMRQRHRGVDIRAQYHGCIDIAGARFDVAHHGAAPGIRNWLRGNVLELYARDILMTEVGAGRRPPDVILRGHYHTFATRVATYMTDNATYEARVTLVPSYSFLDDYARQKARSPGTAKIGMVAYTVACSPDGPAVRQHELWRTVDLRSTEAL